MTKMTRHQPGRQHNRGRNRADARNARRSRNASNSEKRCAFWRFFSDTRCCFDDTLCATSVGGERRKAAAELLSCCSAAAPLGGSAFRTGYASRRSFRPLFESGVPISIGCALYILVPSHTHTHSLSLSLSFPLVWEWVDGCTVGPLALSSALKILPISNRS